MDSATSIIQLVFKRNGVEALEVLSAFRAVNQTLSLDIDKISIQREMTVAELENRLRNGKLDSFSLTQQHTQLIYSHDNRFEPPRMTVWCNHGWGNRIMPILVPRMLTHPSLLMMYELNVPYWHEQNEIFVEHRQRLGYPCDQARISSDNAPYPVTRITYDISNNVGREKRHHEYEEVPAAEMWLGEPFWKATGADLEAVLKAGWLEKEWVNQRVLRIKAWSEMFNSDQGEQGEIQKKLRALLFPRDANEEELSMLLKA